jgi:hypothetical protein
MSYWYLGFSLLGKMCMYSTTLIDKFNVKNSVNCTAFYVKKLGSRLGSKNWKIIPNPAKLKSFWPDHIRINSAPKMILTRWGMFKQGSFMDPDPDPH